MGFRVWGLVFRVRKGSEFRARSLGFRGWGLEFRDLLFFFFGFFGGVGSVN